MMTEGVGRKKPAPIRMLLSPAEMFYLTHLADQRSKNRCYASAPTQWQRGLCPDAVLIGLAGEWAVARFLNRRLGLSLDVDTTDRPRGDGGCDFLVYGCVIQVKTRRPREVTLICRETAAGVLLPFTWHLFISATLYPSVPEEAHRRITLDGWLGRTALLEDARFASAWRGNHHNLELPDDCLLPMTQLVEELLNQNAQIGG